MNPYEVDCKVKDLVSEEEFKACKLEMTELELSMNIQGVGFNISTKGKGPVKFVVGDLVLGHDDCKYEYWNSNPRHLVLEGMMWFRNPKELQSVRNKMKKKIFVEVDGLSLKQAMDRYAEAGVIDKVEIGPEDRAPDTVTIFKDERVDDGQLDTKDLFSGHGA